jgi:hypothetical protein
VDETETHQKGGRSETETLLARARRGDESTLPALRKLFDQAPESCARLGDAAELAEKALLKRAAGKDLALRELMRRRLARVRDELAGPDPTPLEQLLAERAALCWLDANVTDALYATDEGISFKQAEYQGRARERAQRRFLQAVKTLAMVRKLGLPSIQVNIGENQVNVAG